MKAKAALAYQLVFCGLILVGILDRAGIFTQNLQLHTLYSFTTISNACVLSIVLYAALCQGFCGKTLGPPFARLHYLCLVMILITGLVYHFVLLPQKLAENPAYQVLTLGNTIAHYIAPVGMLFNWWMFGQKGLLRRREPILCASVPLVYFVFASIYGYYGASIPGKGTAYVYFFMDIGKLGVAGVLAWVAALLLLVLLLAWSIYALDAALARRKNRQAAS